MNIILFILGILSIAYDAILILINPGTFLDIVVSFTHIWLALGVYLIFLGIYRIKTGHSFWRIWKRWIKITFVSLASIGGTIAIVNLVLILNPAVVGLEDKADNVILLGGGIDKDGRLPKSVITRVEKTAEYLNAHPDAVCVVTGGTLKWLPYAEAPAIKNQLEESGIAGERILVEAQALDTIQNFQYSCAMLSDYAGVEQSEILKSKIVVISNYFHLRRAERLAARLGFTNISGIGASCPFYQVPMSYVREICAYVKLNLRILLTGKPEKII